MNVLARLLDRCDQGNPGDCWTWQGAHNHGGYAVTNSRLVGLSQLVYRALYQLTVGPVPSGLQLDHVCRNRGCVNPDHLEPVTPAENTRRARLYATPQALRTHCKHGHPYDEANTYEYVTAGGLKRRFCRACNRRHVAARRARDRIEAS